MSVLHFLPRLTSWGNLYSKGEGERSQDYSQNDSDDLISLRNKIGVQREIVPPLFNNGRRRRKISYWSENEEDKKYGRDLQRSPNLSQSFSLLSLTLRYSEYGQTRHKKEFVTSWRPQTTFGYKDDFDLERHKLETRKRISYLHAGYNPRQFYRYHSSPQILIRLALTISSYSNTSTHFHFCPEKGTKRLLLE